MEWERERERRRRRAQGNCLSLVTSPDKGWAESCILGNLHAEFGCRFEVSRFNSRLVSVSPCKGVEEMALDKQRGWTVLHLQQRKQSVPQWALSLRWPCGVVPNWGKGRSLRAPGLASHWVLTGPKKVVCPRAMRRLSLEQLSESATNGHCSPGTWGPAFSRVGGAECPASHCSLHESDPRGQRWGWEDWEGSDGEGEAASRSTSSHRAGRCSGHPGLLLRAAWRTLQNAQERASPTRKMEHLCIGSTARWTMGLLQGRSLPHTCRSVLVLE